MVPIASGAPRTSDRVQVQFRSLTREGDVGLAIGDRPGEVRNWSMRPVEPDRHLPRENLCSGAEGDVQGDVGRSCCVRMRLPDGVERRPWSAAGTAG